MEKEKFELYQKQQLKKGIHILRRPGADRKEEMYRRQCLRDVSDQLIAPLTMADRTGKGMRYKTGKYIPAGEHRNVNHKTKHLR